MNFFFHYNALAIIKRLTDFHIALIPCFQEKLPILSIHIQTLNHSYKQKKSSLEVKKSRKNNGCICNQHYCHLLFHKWTFVLSNIELSVSVLNGQLTISSLIRKPTGYPVNFLFPYPKHNATRFCNLVQQFGA